MSAVLLQSNYVLSHDQKSAAKPNKFKRVRPGDPGWPTTAKWETLNKEVHGRLIPLSSPFQDCKSKGNDCSELFRRIKNPYATGDDPALTQTLGWHNAWKSEASTYAIAATSPLDVVAAVNFARINKLRLVVKGGGHSYQGTSNAKDSLLVWTRSMNEITINESFVAKNCDKVSKAQPAVTIGAGAVWMHVYDKVTTQSGWYVQGGGCGTVGVAGLIQSGGFGSLSKSFGLAAAALLEAEVVTADGKIVIANECTNPDLFWGLKGGGGGSLGVVTRLTLRLRKLPEHVGAVFGRVKAANDDAFHQLTQFMVEFYNKKLFNSYWGEQLRFYGNNVLNISMLFPGIDEGNVKEIWKEVEDFVSNNSELFTWEQPLSARELPAQNLWNPAFFKTVAPGLIGSDDRPGAREKNFFWAGDQEEAGQYLYGYRSLWLSQKRLLNRHELGNAIFKASRSWTVSLHFNKGLAGSPEEDKKAALNTAMNPEVIEAFALAIIAGASDPAMPGVENYEPDHQSAQRNAERIDKAMSALQEVEKNIGSYVSESNYFEKKWQQSFWGSNYERLRAVKNRYDPDGLFFVHHGVGSDEWSADGFQRL